ncbi:MAG: sigma-70 family RNA polymerase sigma factor [Flavobacteriaceae bacterium]
MDQKSIADLQSDDRLKLKSLYDGFRDAFFGFFQSWHVDENDLPDIYQEAFLALRKHAINGKLDTVKCGMKTYLFQIGKYMIIDQYKQRSKFENIEPHLHLAGEETVDIVLDPHDFLNAEKRKLKKFFKELDEKCRELLTLFYYRGLSLEEIAPMTNRSNANVVKVQKHRCLEKLRSRMLN